MKQKLFMAGLLVIIASTFLEIAFYFVYIFKPVDRIAGKDLGVVSGIPTASELFIPVVLSRYITNADESKTFYQGRLESFVQELSPLMPSKSSFVKVVEANYVLGGTVVEIKHLRNELGNLSVGCEITLKNSSGGIFTEHINPSEVMYAKVFLRSLLSGSYSRSEVALADIEQGDYLAIKRSTNLLNPAERKIEIEILRIFK